MTILVNKLFSKEMVVQVIYKYSYEHLCNILNLLCFYVFRVPLRVQKTAAEREVQRHRPLSQTQVLSQVLLSRSLVHIFCGSNHKNVFYVSVLFYCDCHVAWLLNNSLQLFFLNEWKRASASNMSKVQWKPFVQMNYLRLRGSMMLHWLTLSVPLNNQRRNRKRLRSQTRLSFAHSFNKFQIDTEGNAISKPPETPFH